MQSETAAIIRLAWTGILDLDDDLLEADGDRRLSVVRPETGSVSFVQLLGQGIVIGPDWAVERVSTVEDAVLASVSGLLRLAADHHPQALGESVLAYFDDYCEWPGLTDAAVTDDPQAVVDLEKSCPPDDVAEVGLAELDSQFALINELDEPVAGAGFDIWGGILAHLGVLTAPSLRGLGHGTLIAALASNAAMDEGLIPQWRSRVDNHPSRRLAKRLGFTEVGTQTTVLLNEAPE